MINTIYKTIILLAVIFTLSVKAYAASIGTCEIRFVRQNGDFRPGDANPYGLTIATPFPDGWYPNATTTQRIPSASLGNCITYRGVPIDAVIDKIRYTYTFGNIRFNARYGIMITGGHPVVEIFNPSTGTNGGGSISATWNGSLTQRAGTLLKDVSIDLHAQFKDVIDNSNCPSPSQCPAVDTQLNDFTIFVDWISGGEVTFVRLDGTGGRTIESEYEKALFRSSWNGKRNVIFKKAPNFSYRISIDGKSWLYGEGATAEYKGLPGYYLIENSAAIEAILSAPLNTY